MRTGHGCIGLSEDPTCDWLEGEVSEEQASPRRALGLSQGERAAPTAFPWVFSLLFMVSNVNVTLACGSWHHIVGGLLRW